MCSDLSLLDIFEVKLKASVMLLMDKNQSKISNNMFQIKIERIKKLAISIQKSLKYIIHDSCYGLIASPIPTWGVICSRLWSGPMAARLGLVPSNRRSSWGWAVINCAGACFMCDPAAAALQLVSVSVKLVQ